MELAIRQAHSAAETSKSCSCHSIKAGTSCQHEHDDVSSRGLGEFRTYIKDRMAAETHTVLGARLDPLFYTTSGDPEIWKLSLKANP